MELDELKQFLKVDGNDQDLILIGYQLAAEEYLKNAGVMKTYDNALYKIIVTTIVATFLENPSLIAGSGNANNLAITMSSLIDQLRH